MARFGSVVLGAGLVVLWIVGLNQGATMWLTWLLGLAGLTSIVLASMLPAEHGREGAKPPAIAGFVLFAVWILAVASRATAVADVVDLRARRGPSGDRRARGAPARPSAAPEADLLIQNPQRIPNLP